PRNLLAPRLIDLPREALAQLVRRGRDGIEHAHNAPQIISLLGQLQGTAPAVEPHELRNRNAIAEWEGGNEKATQIAASALDDGKSFGNGKLQQRITAPGVQTPRDELDRFETKCHYSIAARHALGRDRRSELEHIFPGLGLCRCPTAVTRA